MMLEEAIPALWSAVHGFFTPAVLFILLNVVIGTIAVTSKASAPSSTAAEGEDASGAGGGAEQPQQRRLSRVPSMAFERLRSFNLSRFAAPAPEPSADGVVDLGYVQPPEPPAVEKEEIEAAVEPEPEPEPEPEHAQAHMERSRSEAAAGLEAPRLPARLHKSASDKSAFAHFEAAEVEEAVQAVEKRRPATSRDGARRRGRRLPVAEPVESESESEPEEDASGEVDARADDFINRFHHQLKLQRMDSILRYRESVRRGAAAAAGGV